MNSDTTPSSARPFFLLLMFFWTAFCWGWFGYETAVRGQSPTAWALFAAPLLVAFLVRRAAQSRERWFPALDKLLTKHTEFLDTLPQSRLPWLIALAACLGLYAELTVIRLHSSDLQLFAYFKNVSLLSCFLGLGIGYAASARRVVATPLVMPALALQLLFTNFLERLDASLFLQNPIPEQFSLGMYEARQISVVAVFGFLAFIFAFNALCFVPLGQVAGRLMSREPSKLRAYSWNLLGSIAGILLFNLTSALWAPPVVWILVTTLMFLPFLRLRRALVPTIVSVLVLITSVAWIEDLDHYHLFSPYQKLTVKVARNMPPEIEVSNVYYQRMLDLSPESLEKNADLQKTATYYNLPYQFHDDAENVLIVGSGSGNDVAAAIRHGVAHVDAVELDPAILELGRLFHPEDPYGGDPETSKTIVTPHIQDARAYIRYSDQTYDLIVFALLDSHTLLSSASSVRLDSFVYTIESLREARERLSDDGVLSMTFSAPNRYLAKKILLMLQEAFDGRQPLVFFSEYDFGVSYIIGKNENPPLPPGSIPLRDVTQLLANNDLHPDISTDDWPFFYMPQRKYPVSYMVMVLLLVGISFVFVRRLMPPREDGTRAFSSPCFFLGAGFMLVETKGITELALVFGSTWVVVGVVITAILTMAFFANLLVLAGKSPPQKVNFLLLFIALAAGLAVVAIDPGGWSLRMEQIVRTTMLTLPLFFSGLAFSREVQREASVETAMASNILGAMMGGFLEYNSMYFGFRSLYFMAMAMYLAAFVTALRRDSKER